MECSDAADADAELSEGPEEAGPQVSVSQSAHAEIQGAMELGAADATAHRLYADYVALKRSCSVDSRLSVGSVRSLSASGAAPGGGAGGDLQAPSGLAVMHTAISAPMTAAESGAPMKAEPAWPAAAVSLVVGPGGAGDAASLPLVSATALPPGSGCPSPKKHSSPARATAHATAQPAISQGGSSRNGSAGSSGGSSGRAKRRAARAGGKDRDSLREGAASRKASSPPGSTHPAAPASHAAPCSGVAVASIYPPYPNARSIPSTTASCGAVGPHTHASVHHLASTQQHRRDTRLPCSMQSMEPADADVVPARYPTSSPAHGMAHGGSQHRTGSCIEDNHVMVGMAGGEADSCEDSEEFDSAEPQPQVSGASNTLVPSVEASTHGGHGGQPSCRGGGGGHSQRRHRSSHRQGGGGGGSRGRGTPATAHQLGS